MSDLTYCYIHMTKHDIQALSTIETDNYFSGELSDDEIDVPSHMKPPNPQDADVLPSAIHPSYPYGNPTNPSHPAARPRRPADPSSRALFQDTGFGGGGVNDAMQWTDLAIDVLLPKDEEREARARAATARKLASGAATHQQPQQAQAQQQDITFEGEEAENDENLNDIDEDTEDGTLDEDD